MRNNIVLTLLFALLITSGCEENISQNAAPASSNAKKSALIIESADATDSEPIALPEPLPLASNVPPPPPLSPAWFAQEHIGSTGASKPSRTGNTDDDDDDIDEECGNGVIEDDEECEVAEGIDSPTCVDCKIVECGPGGSSCGNGEIDIEECDDGNDDNDDDCTEICMAPFCGDGFVNGMEECDDADSDNENRCSNTCTLNQICGDGLLEVGEQCDDGNTTSDDGCSATCTKECGPLDGVMDGLEQCEIGLSGDANCTENCQLAQPSEICDEQPGSLTLLTPETCIYDISFGTPPSNVTNLLFTVDKVYFPLVESCPVTGPGIYLIPGTDPMGPPDAIGLCNTINCDQNTSLEFTYYCDTCRDGIQQPGTTEECDDGNEEEGDDCTNMCMIAFCGDGVVKTQGDEQEECDRGSQNSNTTPNACREDCTNPSCGDGVFDREQNEQCDDGNDADDDDCSNNCILPNCGNGALDLYEECDDGNVIDGDNCNSRCQIEICGNGYKDVQEACDDGNLVNGDGCESDCTLPSCGDGVRDPYENCDDGNNNNNDGCDEDCWQELGFNCDMSEPTICMDIDECSEPMDPCPENTMCMNTIGSFECVPTI